MSFSHHTPFEALESTSIKLVDLRKSLGDKVNSVNFTNNRYTITRNGKAVAALISADDLALLEELELIRDTFDFEQAIKEDDGYRITLADLKAKYGLA